MKTAVVTGYKSGMGKGAAKALEELGYDVISWDISTEEKVDVTNSESVKAAADKISKQVAAVILTAGVYSEASLLET